jgi:hypothetical protein
LIWKANAKDQPEVRKERGKRCLKAAKELPVTLFYRNASFNNLEF